MSAAVAKKDGFVRYIGEDSRPHNFAHESEDHYVPLSDSSTEPTVGCKMEKKEGLHIIHSPEKGTDKTSKKAGEERIEATTVGKVDDKKEIAHETVDSIHYATATTTETGTLSEDAYKESVLCYATDKKAK